MGKDGKSWRKYFDSRSEENVSDYELDRGFSSQDQEIEESKERSLLNFIQPRQTDIVFDAGCGTGVNIERFCFRVSKIVGMDYSEAVINRAKTRLDRGNIQNAQLFVGSVTDVPMKSDCFDKALCISVLQYVDDAECELALKEFVRILKNDGILVLHVKNLFSLYLSTLYVAKWIKSLFRKEVIFEYYRPFTWYWRALSKLGAEILNYDSTSILLLDFMPKPMYSRLQKMEVKYGQSKFLKKYGADFVIMAKVRKTQGMVEA